MSTEGRKGRSHCWVEVQTAQWQPMVGTPTLVPEPSTVIFRAGAGIQAFCAAALAMSSDTWTNRNRNSVREFSSSRCSSMVRLPLVFSSSTDMRSMLWRASGRLGSGFSSSPKCNRPSCTSACVRKLRTRKEKDAGGRGIWKSSCGVSSGIGSLISSYFTTGVQNPTFLSAADFRSNSVRPMFHASSFSIPNPNDQTLAEHPRRPRHGIQRDRHIPRVQQAIQLRPAGLKVSRHRLFGLLLLLHFLRELPRQHSLDRDSFHFLPNAFLFQEIIEARSAMVESDLLLSLLHGSPRHRLPTGAQDTILPHKGRRV